MGLFVIELLKRNNDNVKSLCIIEKMRFLKSDSHYITISWRYRFQHVVLFQQP